MLAPLQNTDWGLQLRDELQAPYFKSLIDFVSQERQQHTIYPRANLVFNAFTTTPFSATRVVILGQDPYHGPEQAHGLCFSVPDHMPAPPSLRNILKELADDIGPQNIRSTCLQHWATQGILLLNTVLTVRDGNANSHQKRGWETFTDAAIARLGQREAPCIFVLWGAPAQKKRRLIDTSKHVIIESAHPSPLSAYRGFFGSKPFSKINAQLLAWGQTPIDWATT